MKEDAHYPINDNDWFPDAESIASGTECTGLIPTPPESEEEAEAYTELYNIPKPENDLDNALQQVPGIHERRKKEKDL